MTDRRDLKRRVRDRQARTGESYMTALRHVRGQRGTSVPVVELVDVTQIGEALGFKCPVKIVPQLAERIDVGATFRQLRDALISTAGDPASAVMRDVVLHGARPQNSRALHEGATQFMKRVRVGIGGFSNGGLMLAFNADGRQGSELVIFMLWITPLRLSLILASSDTMFGDPANRWSVLSYGLLHKLP